jgi:hypothetical protein
LPTGVLKTVEIAEIPPPIELPLAGAAELVSLKAPTVCLFLVFPVLLVSSNLLLWASLFTQGFIVGFVVGFVVGSVVGLIVHFFLGYFVGSIDGIIVSLFVGLS